MLNLNFKTACRYYISFTFLFFVSANIHAQYLLTDTIYYNKFWYICEKPVAAYFRTCALLSMNNNATSGYNMWYYAGEVKDYKMDHTLIMQGNYSEKGIKEGDYKFYYPDGKLMASGKYKKDSLIEKWNLYYPDGKEKAIIDFSDRGDGFEVLKFNDEQGNTLLENGNGSFTLHSDLFEWEHRIYVITGSYKDGKRSGTWHFDPFIKTEKKHVNFRIKYNKLGKAVKDEYDYYQGLAAYKLLLITMMPFKFYVTEKMGCDDLFGVNGDGTKKEALAYYLMERKPVEVELRYKIFNVAFNTILKTLNYFGYKLHFTQDRNINGKLEFKIGSKGFLENINFSGDGLEIDEMNFFTFLLGKFKHVEMPGDQNVGQETNFTLYIFSMDFREVMDNNSNNADTKQLVFSFKTREQEEKYMREHKDEIKQLNKDRKDAYYLENH